jgi:hypothetical protein
MEESANEVSMFQTKYNEFVEDLLGALPEYTSQIQAAKLLSENDRLIRYQQDIKVVNTLGGGDSEDFSKNPGIVLPGVEITDSVWGSLSDNTKKAIWEYVRIISICCFMEAGFGGGDSKTPAWMDDAMNEMKKKLEGVDFQNIIKKFMTFFKPGEGEQSESDGKGGLPGGFEKLFESGFPKIPEKFLKGHMAKLAQEIVKDITPEDLGISSEMVSECEKNPSRAFDILFQVFGSNSGNIQKIIGKIGKKLQQKVMSGAIRPQEIAREAEELMKEFAGNSNFVEMMEGIKGAFGFEDMNLARQAGREGSARLAMVRERLKKKASEKQSKKAGASNIVVNNDAEEIANQNASTLLLEESKSKKKLERKRPGQGGKK